MTNRLLGSRACIIRSAGSGEGPPVPMGDERSCERRLCGIALGLLAHLAPDPLCDANQGHAPRGKPHAQKATSNLNVAVLFQHVREHVAERREGGLPADQLGRLERRDEALRADRASSTRMSSERRGG